MTLGLTLLPLDLSAMNPSDNQNNSLASEKDFPEGHFVYSESEDAPTASTSSRPVRSAVKNHSAIPHGKNRSSVALEKVAKPTKKTAGSRRPCKQARTTPPSSKVSQKSKQVPSTHQQNKKPRQTEAQQSLLSFVRISDESSSEFEDSNAEDEDEPLEESTTAVVPAKGEEEEGDYSVSTLMIKQLILTD